MQVVTCFHRKGTIRAPQISERVIPIYPRIYRKTSHESFSDLQDSPVGLLDRRRSTAMLWPTDARDPSLDYSKRGTLNPVIALLTVVFVLSGAAGLIYESIWSR